MSLNGYYSWRDHYLSDEKSNIIEKALEKVDLLKRKNFLASELTLMERKKVELARALTTEPRLLLLDELMTGLNPTEQDELITLIKSLSEDEGLTICLVEHVMRVIMSISDRIAVLNFGKKIADAPPSEIVNDKEVIVAYLGEG